MPCSDEVILLLPTTTTNNKVILLISSGKEKNSIPREKKDTGGWLRTLPLQTPIVVQAAHVKTGQAGERWNRYKEATTLGELAERNPGRFFIDDLKYDYKHGLVRLGSGGYPRGGRGAQRGRGTRPPRGAAGPTTTPLK